MRGAFGREKARKRAAAQQTAPLLRPMERKAPVSGPTYTGAIALDMKHGERGSFNKTNRNPRISGEAQEQIPILMLAQPRVERDAQKQSARRKQG